MKVRKKRKFKKRYWLSAGLAAAAVSFVLLLLYKPAGFTPLEVVHEKQVSTYLTHELLPQLYNGAQRQEPFDLIVTQRGINDIVARSKWPKGYDGVRFSAPKVFFVPESIVLMGTAVVGGVEFVVTVVAEPRVDKDGLLNLRVTKVKIGAMNITLVAKLIAKKMYAQRLATTDINIEDLRAQIATSLLNDEPFEPVFKIEDKKVQAKKITIHDEKLTIRLVPVFD